ncbi:MAG: hypothetical protein M1817_003968 [Caeruleum heppii]|nr:MAG: hypothetical protein M1817_003968 [Caeruleum heppii]
MQKLSTATKPNSIWSNVGQEQFSSKIAQLAVVSKQIPGPNRTYTEEDWHRKGNADHGHILRFDDERQLAEDFAYLAAWEKGRRAVTAVALEQSLYPPKLTVRVAANVLVVPTVRRTLQEVVDLLAACARREIPQTECIASVFDRVVHLNESRINQRLCPPGATKSSSPTQRLVNISSSLSSQSTQQEKILVRVRSKALEVHARHRELQQASPSNKTEALKSLIRSASALSCVGRGKSLDSLLRSYGAALDDVDAKAVRTIDKVGNYWRLCSSLTKFAQVEAYQPYVSALDCHILAPYTPSKIRSKSRALAIVHAEIQLLVYYELNPLRIQPRVIGVSKAACFLCDLCIQIHARFYIRNTHGKLYKGWTLPDLQQYSRTSRAQFRRTLHRMVVAMNDAEAAVRVREKTPGHGVESFVWENPRFPPTPSASTLRGTVLSSQWPSSVGIRSPVLSVARSSVVEPVPSVRLEPSPLVPEISSETPEKMHPINSSVSDFTDPSSNSTTAAPLRAQLPPDPVDLVEENAENVQIPVPNARTVSSRSSSDDSTASIDVSSLTVNPQDTQDMPFQRITPSRPFRLKTSFLNISLSFEELLPTQPPVHGLVAVIPPERLSEQSDRIKTIDLTALEADEELCFPTREPEKDGPQTSAGNTGTRNGSEEVILHLRTRRGAVAIACRWVEGRFEEVVC